MSRPVASSTTAPATPFSSVLDKQSAEDSDQAKIEASCRQFEGIMVKQILTASKLPFVGGGKGGGAVGAIYNDLVTQNLADQITQGGGIGLASALQTQLSRQSKAVAKHSTPATTD